MNILIVQDGPDAIGGIQTLVSRFSSWLVREGHKPTLLVRSAVTWRCLLHPEVNLIEIGDRMDDAYLPWRGRSVSGACDLLKIDSVIHMEFQTAVVSSNLFDYAAGYPSVVIGNFMPDFPGNANWRLSGLMWRLKKCYYSRVVLNSQKLFMSNSQLLNLRRCFGARLDGSVLPLAVDIRKFSHVMRNPVPGRIVTVCRLDPMKRYVIPLVHAMKKLRDGGFYFSLDIYGVGPMREEIETEIEANGLQEFVVLKGHLEYRNFSEVMSSAFAFVGMGTTIVEAAACGVPAILAIAHDASGRSPGFLGDCIQSDLGDSISVSSTSSFERIIRELAELPEVDYNVLENEMRRRATRYDCEVVFPNWLKIASKSKSRAGGFILRYAISLTQMLIKLRNI